jgi:hypothetical protein
LSEPLPPLPEDLESLLEVERDMREPPGVKERVLKRLEAKLPLDSPSRPELVPNRPVPRRSRLFKWSARFGIGGATGIARLAVAFASGGVVTLGVNAAVEHSREVKRERQRAEAQSHAAPPAAAKPASETEIPPPPSPAVSPPPAPDAPAPGSAVQVPPERHRPSAKNHSGAQHPVRAGVAAEERTLLEDARVALQRGDITEALQMLTAHEQRFPTSALSEERDALLVREAVRAGSYGQARAWLRAFREHYPGSPMLPVLESALRDAHEDEDKR